MQQKKWKEWIKLDNQTNTEDQRKIQKAATLCIRPK